MAEAGALHEGLKRRPIWRVRGYVVEGELGRGASSVVYLARHTLLGRHVALKRIAFDAVSDEVSVRRLEVEVAALVQLEHPGIVRLMDLLAYEDRAWLVMEYVEGPTLRTVLDLRSGKLAPADALAILESLSAVLDHVSGRGIVHRDLKPANVFLTLDGRCKLGDFGIASLAPVTSGGTDGHGRLTRPGTVLGTPAYLSPEQALGAGELGSAADIYSLGVIAYELLTGKVPFPYRGNLLAVLASHASDSPPRLRSIRPELPGPVDDAVLAALEKQPWQRPAGGSEFWGGLEPAAKAAWPGWRQEVDLGRLAAECQIRVAGVEAGIGRAEAGGVGMRTLEEGATEQELGVAAPAPGRLPAPGEPSPGAVTQASTPVTAAKWAAPVRLPRSSSRGGGTVPRSTLRRWLVVAVIFVVATVAVFLLVRAIQG